MNSRYGSIIEGLPRHCWRQRTGGAVMPDVLQDVARQI